MSSNDRTGHPSAYEYHRRQIADLEAERDKLKEQREYWMSQTNEARTCIGKLEPEVDRLRNCISNWCSRLQWADGLSEVVQEMREEAKR